ncbi:MAG: hypothetical protein ACR2KF_06930, partial [Nitrososphaeraceae archaeon]
FDDPEHLGEPSNIFIDSMMRFETLDYARRYFERKGDKSSLQRPKEIRKLYNQMILDSVYIVRSLIPKEVMHESYHARETYLKEKDFEDNI